MNVKALLIVVCGLLVAVLIGVVIVVNQLSAADRQADYERCLQANGIDLSAARDDVEALVAASEACLD